MKFKIYGIIVCMLLFIAMLPVSPALEPETQGIKLRTIMFTRGRIDGISDDVVNGIACYRCPIINIYEIYLYTITIIPVGIQRDHRTGPGYALLIPKDMFHGILTETYVIGLIEWWY